VVAIPDGGFVVVWEDRSRGAVFGRRFDSSGTGDGSEFELEGVVPFFGLATQRGELVVAWGDIVGRFSLDGTLLDRLVVPGADVREGRSVATTPSGQLGVVWDGVGGEQTDVAEPIRGNARSRFPGAFIRAQRVNAGGELSGPSFAVAEDDIGNGYPKVPRIAGGPDESFVVVWWAEGSGALWGQGIDAEDRRLGERFPVAEPGQLHNFATLDICAHETAAEFVVSWHDYGVRFRRFDNEAQPLSPMRCAGLGGAGSLSCLPEKRFVVSGGIPIGIFDMPFLTIRVFSNDERLIGNVQLPLSSRTFQTPSATGLNGDTFVVVWTDCGKEESGCDVFGQRFRLSVDEECAGDCNGDGHVSVYELLLAVSLALQNYSDLAVAASQIVRCGPVDTNLDCSVSINEIVAAVGRALEGCD
jgi:hypothetical protein